MKRLAALISTLILCLSVSAQDSSMLEKPRVDRNVELMSIVWRLAGKPEYSATNFKLYTDRIEEHFGPHRNHELIGFVQSIIRDNGISYDAVASMAAHLDEELNLRTDVAAGSLEGRWKNVDKDRFVTLLKKFASDTEADRFFAANAELYDEAVRRFMPNYEAIDLKWYADFFGRESEEKFVIINALGNGLNNYGPSIEYPDGRREVYAVIGASRVDEKGMVVFPMGNDFMVMLHEFNHSFVNPLNAGFHDDFRESGEALFAVVGEQMRRQAYPAWEYVFNEIMCNALVLKYVKDHDLAPNQQALDGLMKNFETRGYLWIRELVDELDKYDAARDEYPTLDDYMPRIVEAYRGWAEVIVARQAAGNN